MYLWLRVAIFFAASFYTTLCLQLQATPSESDNPPESLLTLDQVVDRAIARERQEVKEISTYTPVIETYIQEVQPDPQLGTVPRTDFYFLGQADLSHGVKVHSMIESPWKPSFHLWTFEPAGFLQMTFVDHQDFDRAHYRFKSAGREFLGEVRCYVFDVTPAPMTRGARFVGRIWIEDQSFVIVRFNGKYTPSVSFSWKNFDNEYYLHFDSWRANVKSGVWLPSYIYSQELGLHDPFGVPNFKSSTHIWGYQLKSGSRSDELSRVLLENPAAIKDEATQHDRSPLEAQREWRHEAEDNVLDLLERNGILAPPGPVDTTLNTVVTNLEITNNLEGQIDLRCRLLLTSNLELFAIGNTIVISRGLVDAVPDESTLAAFLAHGIADAMNPKAEQDQYGFSDILRLSATEVLKRLSFEENPAEAKENSDKAVELLKKSPYVAKMDNAGLFLKQLQSQSKALKCLISPHLGNQVYFAEQLLQAAPALEPTSTTQIAALPLGSRVKIDAWSAGVTLLKSKQVNLLSPRDKIPFAIVPLLPYLTRHTESSTASSAPPRETAPVFD
jgi:hypothetical protein